MLSPGESESENVIEENFIDCGIKDVANVRLRPNISTLSLHYNSISVIRGLDNLNNLKHLDLSSNAITKISGLDSLIHLRTLNLSANRIKKLEGLSQLRQLVKLNASYNEISDLMGLNELANTRGHPLASLELHANRIRLISDVTKACQRLGNLKRLILRDAYSENPVCGTPDYRQKVFASLPHLRILDGRDKSGKSVDVNILSDIPGLEQFIDYLSSSTDQCSEFNSTIKNHFNEPKLMDTNNNNIQSNQSPPIDKSDYQQKSVIGNQKPKETERITQSNISMAAMKERPEETNYTKESEKIDKQSTDKISQSAMLKKEKRSEKRDCTNGGDWKVAKLIKELDQERYKRINTENRLQSLISQYKELQLAILNDKRSKEDAIKSTERLTEAFSREKTARMEAENRLKELQARFNESAAEFANASRKWEETEAQWREKLQARDNHLLNVSEQMARTNKELDDSKLAQKVAEANVTSIKKLCSNLENQVDDLQSTLSRREKEYQMTLTNRYTLDSKELKDYVDKQVNAAKTESLHEINAWKNKLVDSNNMYKDLENEFRAALHMEADRFNKMENSYLQALTENNVLKSKSDILTKKDEESKALISELTAVVKDQKCKLLELSRNKQETNRNNKERILTLEAHVEEARRQMLQFELTKQQENKKLHAKLSAQESVLEGLRTERKLWSEELAQQGYLLTQDRAKLECKIESQASEISSLKMELEKEAETVKIKCKIIEDQTAVILKIKDGLAEKDNETKMFTEKLLEDQKAMETKIQNLMRDNSECQDTIIKLTKRKEELKDMIVELQDKLEESEATQEAVNQKWKNKSELIAKLESQVVQMKDFWEKKTSELIEEKNEAQEKLSSLQSRLESVEHNHKLQLEMAHKSRDFIRQEADEKILAVEDEMRRLLLETDEEKKKLNSRLKVLNKAIQELDSDRASRY